MTMCCMKRSYAEQRFVKTSYKALSRARAPKTISKVKSIEQKQPLDAFSSFFSPAAGLKWEEPLLVAQEDPPDDPAPHNESGDENQRKADLQIGDDISSHRLAYML